MSGSRKLTLSSAGSTWAEGLSLVPSDSSSEESSEEFEDGNTFEASYDPHKGVSHYRFKVKVGLQ